MHATLRPPEDHTLNYDTIIAVSAGEFELPDDDGHAPALEPVSKAPEPVSFKIRLANDEGRRSSASYLIEKRYNWRGYQTPSSAAAPNRITLVASDDKRALGTITIGFDSPEGLLVDTLYHDEVQSVRAAGGKLCEFTRLAVDINRQSREMLAMLFHIAYMYAHRLHDCTDLLIEVNPRHVRFYQVMLGFEILGNERICPRVNAPAVLLRLDLSHTERQIARYGGHRELANSVRSLYPLAFAPREEEGICGRLRTLEGPIPSPAIRATPPSQALPLTKREA